MQHCLLKRFTLLTHHQLSQIAHLDHVPQALLIGQRHSSQLNGHLNSICDSSSQSCRDLGLSIWQLLVGRREFICLFRISIFMVALMIRETSRSSGRNWIVVGGSTTTGSIGSVTSVWGSRMQDEDTGQGHIESIFRQEYHWWCCGWSCWWLSCCWPCSGHRARWLKGLQWDGILVPENVFYDIAVLFQASFLSGNSSDH